MGGNYLEHCYFKYRQDKTDLGLIRSPVSDSVGGIVGSGKLFMCAEHSQIESHNLINPGILLYSVSNNCSEQIMKSSKSLILGNIIKLINSFSLKSR